MNTRLQVHLARIPNDGAVQVDEEIDAAFLDLAETEWTADSPVRCSVQFTVSGGDIYAIGTASLDLSACCVKCLEDFETTLTLPDLAIHKEPDGRELADLTDELREDILLLLPSHPRCDVDGKRECPVTFRTSPEAPLATERTPRPDAWNALDEFKPNP
ncbi:MAG: hypothetical protein WA771_07785 [Chthoniobacterales bacterium]